MAYRKSNKRF